jgi:hypothetical protein
MNLTLHHFRKEFCYLRLRWLAFLVLLALDLAVNLEWVLPLRAGVNVPGWLSYLPTVLMLAGMALLGSCPEDKPGSDRSFISTRPLPMRSYWQARIALWLLLLVVPVVLQNALYLVLSHRPVSEIMTGTWDKAVETVRVTVWVLPMTALWRRGEFWAALGCLAAGYLIADRVVDFAGLKWLNSSLSYQQNSVGLTAAMLVFALGLFWMAWRHQAGSVKTFRWRLLVMLGIATVCLMMARLWPWNDEDPPQNQARANELAPQLKVDVDMGLLEFSGFAAEWQRRLSLPIRTETPDPHVSVLLRPQSTLIVQGDNSSRSIPSSGWRRRDASFQVPSQTLMATDTVLRDLFPAGTLFTTSSDRSPWGMHTNQYNYLCEFKPPLPDPKKPLSVTTDYEVDWYQRDIALDLPLQAGANGESEGTAVRIMQVNPNENEKGVPSLGGLSVHLHVSTHHIQTGPLADPTLLLYSPQRHLVWLEPAFQQQQPARAGGTGWSRLAKHLSWRNVLNFADGEDAKVDVSQLRVMLLRSRYLGTTGWTWKSPDIVLADHPPRRDPRQLYRQEIYVGREVKAFQERLATLKAPVAGSTEAEARRYLYDLIAITKATEVAYKKAALKEVGDAFRPLLQNHLPLMLELPSELWPGWNNYPPKSLLDEYLTEEQRDSIIDRVMTNTMLTDTIIRKGWSEAARRLEPRLLAAPRLPYGIDNLLLKWGDEASLERLMQELRFQDHGFSHHYEPLDKFPSLRPRLEEFAQEAVLEEVPALRNENYWVADRFKKAAEYGSSEALEVCLRWMAMGGDQPSSNCGLPYPELLEADGAKLWKEKVDSEKQWPRYRHLRAADFEYLPEQRAWRLRKP